MPAGALLVLGISSLCFVQAQFSLIPWSHFEFFGPFITGVARVGKGTNAGAKRPKHFFFPKSAFLGEAWSEPLRSELAKVRASFLFCNTDSKNGDPSLATRWVFSPLTGDSRIRSAISGVFGPGGLPSSVGDC
mmetsp:Transcript_59305/g.145608  ORF Transcript_59305/g.145608 Transcript_59305/m.145608 type:complete len:133 (+) Transcript_59305:223-621(+)